MSTATTTPDRTPWLLSGVPSGAEPLVLADLLSGKTQLGKPATLLHIAVGDRALDALMTGMRFFAPEVELLAFPAWDCMPYDRASPHPSIMAARMRTLAALATTKPDRPRLIVATANAVLQKLPPRRAMANICFTIRTGKSVHVDSLLAYLAQQGYRRSGKAMEPGEYAVRGGIIDLIPSGAERGVRIDLFGNEVESLRSFDPLTQRTESALTELMLYPMSEVQLSESTIARFRENYRDLFGAVSREDPLYESISSSAAYPGMEHWLPLFYDTTDTILDYAAPSLITMEQAAPAALRERQESITDYYQARHTANASEKKNSFAAGGIYHPVPPQRFFLMEQDWQKTLAEKDSAILSPFNEVEGRSQVIAIGYRTAIRFAQGDASNTPFDQLKAITETSSQHNRRIILSCFTDGSRDRLQTILLERGFHATILEEWRHHRDLKGKTIGLITLPLEQGFTTDKFTLLSEQDMLGERIIRARPKKKKSEVFMAESVGFSEGELIVHKEHGIGRFEGLITLTVSGASHDCLKIIYEGDDKLFLPVENIEMVSRFGLEEDGVKLDKLGGASWQARKAKLKQRISIAAEALLKIAAERLVKKGEMLDAPTGAYDDFTARFPYAETEDQARAIEEVRDDFNSGKPMDRLICGDVGFGKTEVALRAAFIAACGSSPVQVAVVTPTTLLARQHFKNFKTRFEGFPVEVRQLSRMVPANKQKETRDLLKEGKVHIVVGTHALLSKQVQFDNLGLVIVDEEQHFGVAQKEKLKELKSDVHVLTLSATPIPRTLQMALTGVRDLSLITTPPVDRLAIRSFVMPFDPVVVREAIQREMHRGGKCFVVTPRIKDMADLKHKLAEIVPEARIATAHGQMPAADLDTIMNEFYDGKFDILLSTAIIESGLDVPTANTMIIHNAHLFGLAQLYQMRGRVGRGKLRAYAYFMLPHHRELTKNATRRLEVMQTLDTLGAGFTLASHDMDIRGFGNLVGEEQSGHIKEVGIELYQQMLEDAVASMKHKSGQSGEPDPATSTGMDWSPQINMGLSVLIPKEYVPDLSLRLGLYRRIAGMQTEEDISSFAAELTDRFGPAPAEVSQLIATLGIKLLCKKAGIERIDAGPKGAVITFRGNVFAKPDALMSYVEKNIRHYKVRPDMKLVYTRELTSDAEKLQYIRTMAESIAALAA